MSSSQESSGSALRPGLARDSSRTEEHTHYEAVTATPSAEIESLITPSTELYQTPLETPLAETHGAIAAMQIDDADIAVDGDVTPRARSPAPQEHDTETRTATTTTAAATATATATATAAAATTASTQNSENAHDVAATSHQEVPPSEPSSPQSPAFAPIKTGNDRKEHDVEAAEDHSHEPRRLNSADRRMTEDDLFKTLSRRKTRDTQRTGSTAEEEVENEEIQRLMSRMFGAARQANSEDEKTRHVGVVFKNLTVKGQGLGAATQPTIGGIFMAPFRGIAGLFRGRVRTPVRTLIDDFNGCVKPGEMLLVLGRPGSGCSTFLKVLGNQRSGYEAVEGDVTYGGASSKTMAKDYRGEILYNPEDDLHYATLSVKNTLSFALKTRTPGKASRNEGESRADYIREFLRVVTKLFWIEHTLPTKVGDEHVRGVSGGEKKRVSIAEAMITRASVQCWDNSTRGLDASTALEYVQSLRALTNMAHISTSVALYQAGESLWESFDKVLLIDEGKCLYFGPTDDAVKYFNGLGFERPPRWTSADYLTSVTDPHERKIREGWESRIPRSAEQFAQAFASSDVAKRNKEDIADFERELEEQRRERMANMTKKTKQKNYALPFHKQVIACTWRQFLVMIGDKQSLYGKWGGITFQALIVGSLFYNQPQTAAGVFTRGGVLFFMLLFNALLALAELTSAFSSRPILLKHKTFCFYRPAAYAIAQTVVDIPLVLVQVTIFDVVVYFMSNLSRTPQQFFTSWIYLLMLTLTMYSFFRAIGAWVSSLDVATRITGLAIQSLVLYTGYLIPPDSMHPWFFWIRYINPIAYGFEGLIVNEFHNLEIQCVAPYLVPLQGEAPYQSCLLQGSTPGSTIVSGERYVETAFSYSYSHLWRNFGIVCAFFLGFVVLTMIGMELQKPNKGGAAVTVFKRGEAPKKIEDAIKKGEVSDEEAAVKPGDEGVPSEPVGSTSSEDEKDLKRTESKGVAKNTTIFTWQNVNYSIPTNNGDRLLLRDVQGYVRPGKLTALMGASGAGKTTLLNTLAQRINFGVVTGDFLVDGRPLPKSFQRATGYAEQMDVHEPTATVREALRFSALLRQPRETPTAEKYEYCERIIDLLEMRDIAGATIGKIGEGLNQEQRKRLTIGVELASKPELLLFLDEPTSGLDSGAAFNIVRFLRKLADAGQAILCTIHQPSSVLISHFDELLLLKSGGRVVYHGELGKDSKTLIGYFEKNGAKKCPAGANPAEYMLEAIGAGDPNYKGKDWGDVWANSEEHQNRSEEIQQMIESRMQASDTVKSATDDREFAMPYSTQILAVVKRNFIAYYRTPNYMVGKFMLHIMAGLFNSFTFYKPGYTSTDMQNRLFSIFITLTISPPLIQQLQPRFLQFRATFSSRERNSKIYGWAAFVVGAILPELPYSVLAGTLYFMCWWWGGVGWKIPDSPFRSAYAWMMVSLFELFYVGFGQAIASFSPNELLASLLVPIFFLFVVSFCGVVAPPVTLPYFWRSWMYPLTPFHYLLEGLLGVVVHDLPVVCNDKELARFNAPPGQTCENYTAGMPTGYVQTMPDGSCAYCQYKSGDEFAAGFSVYYDHRWRNYGIFWAYVLFNFMVVFAASYIYLVGGRKLIKKLKGEGKPKKKENAMKKVQDEVEHEDEEKMEKKE